MSAAAPGHSHGHEALAQVDPTRTKTLRKRYAQKLRGGFADINTQIRRGVRDRDIFGLASEALARPPPSFDFGSDDRKHEAFMRWLREQEQRDVLSVISRGENTYIRSAYGSGLRHAERELRKQGVDVSEADLATAFNLPVHQDALQLLYTRNYEQLEGINRAVAQQISRELTQGFSEGVNPEVMARRLTDRVDSIGKTRATVLARTEVVNAHSEATLNRFERMGVEGVGARVEWSTAGDPCAICASLEGKVYSLDDARGRLPAHPQCRCAWLPFVSTEAMALYAAHPREFTIMTERNAFVQGPDVFDALVERFDVPTPPAMPA